MTLTVTHRAAGIAFTTQTGQALFLKRGPLGDAPGTWCFPGGHQEGSETAEEAAKRETVEEIGFMPKGKLELACRSVMAQQPPASSLSAGSSDGAAEAGALLSDAAPKVVDYATFSMVVKEPFEPERDKEHIGHAWAPLTSPPEPLHPGVRIAIDRMLADELGVARMMAAGAITSPQVYHNVTLWAMRITGTGVAYRMPVLKRDAKGVLVNGEDGKPIVLCEEEFPWRDPAIYLNDEFLARCNGLPVIWKHPVGAKLDSKEYENRNVGSIFLPFIRGDEVWGIAKVFDDDANEALATGTKEGKDWSTSPGVVISDPNNPSYKFRLEDGSLLLVEGKPSLLDHVAICERGVWDKGGEAAGIINDSLEENKIMVDKTVTKTEPTLADVLAAVGSIGQRVDAIGSRVDAMEEKKDSEKEDEKKDAKKDGFPENLKKDSEKEDEKKDAKKDGETTPESSKEDSAKKDGEDEKDEKKDGEGCAEKVAADAKKDAEDAKKDASAARADLVDAHKRIAAIEAKLPQDRSDDDHRTMSAAQARADSVYEMFGKQAPRFLTGENSGEYRRRLVREFVEHSPQWKTVDVGALPDSAFAVAETQIYADAASAAKDAVGVADGDLRMVHGTTPGGHKKIEFYGDPGSWMGQFGGAKRFATRISPNTKREVN